MIIFMSACSTTSLSGLITTKRSAVITHRSGDQDVGAGVAREEKSLGHAMKREAWVLQVLGMHRLTGWYTCFKESDFQGTHKFGSNEIQKRKGTFDVHFDGGLPNNMMLSRLSYAASQSCLNYAISEWLREPFFATVYTT